MSGKITNSYYYNNHQGANPWVAWKANFSQLYHILFHRVSPFTENICLGMSIG